MTIIDKMLDDEQDISAELALAIEDMPEKANEQMIEQRRDNIAETFAAGDIDHTKAYNLIKQREDQYIDKVRDDYGIENIPKVIIRMEAQDMLIEMLHKELKEHEIIEE